MYFEKLDNITPSRSLDAAIHKRFFGPVLSLSSGVFMDKGEPVPHYTSSIDAAVALCNRLLPAWIWRLCTCHCTDDVWLMPDFNCPNHGKAMEMAWPDCRDPLDDGPGLDISYAPAGRPALGLIAVLFAVIEGIQSGQDPSDHTGALLALQEQADDLSSIETVHWSPPYCTGSSHE